jgi:tetratricopeptide (TPR) repeat protein
VITAAEQLGFLLLEMKRPKEALEAFENALKDSPKRFNSLQGAAQAAVAANLKEKAKAYYSELVEISAPGADRPAHKDAKAYLSAKR